jgi:nitrile hydratase
VLDRGAVSGLPLSRPVEGVTTTDSEAGETPRFAIGDRVRVRDVHTGGHTRCPRYIRGREGVVERADGTFALPDAEAHVDDPPAEPTYCVRFDARELWGEDAEAGVGVSVDLWESYLEPAR